ncbi:hypothetical protein PHJA_001695900 [Phtheirospermum japonicum]|uniref:ZF-HD dimerization-type domain-containing protein n=1 Tax=Phtheirospermum japonicum TaxID=374723 RepID=A0A830C8P4_9LAMI|nr:hypothetical protein PHJA_001695900 [Phtheirospermum japonicum]
MENMGQREESYKECLRIHENLRAKIDGCQKFVEGTLTSDCLACGCHKNFHRVVQPVYWTTRVVHTKCLKIHDFMFRSTVDGCQEFIEGTATDPSACAA